MNDDELDRLLAPPPRAESEGPSARLLTRTERRLLNNRRRRLAWYASGLAASFALGMTSLWLLRPTPAADRIEIVRYVERPAEPAPELPARPLSAYELELAAEQTDGPGAARRFREAGDRYLADEANYRAAIRCYSLYLALSPESEWDDPDGGDSWLLVALKNDKRSENDDANPNG